MTSEFYFTGHTVEFRHLDSDGCTIPKVVEAIASVAIIRISSNTMFEPSCVAVPVVTNEAFVVLIFVQDPAYFFQKQH